MKYSEKLKDIPLTQIALCLVLVWLVLRILSLVFIAAASFLGPVIKLVFFAAAAAITLSLVSS